MRRGRIIIGLAVFAAALALGFAVARPLAPSRLQAEVEEILSELLGGDVKVGTLRVSVGWGLRLEGTDVVAWPEEAGPALRAERAIAEIRPLAHLTGQRRVRSITLEQPVMRVTRARDGSFTPPPAQELFGSEEPTDGEAMPQELLHPLIAVETTLRRGLRGAVVADRFEIVGGRIDFRDEHRGRAREIALDAIRGRLTHSGFFDETHLVLAARLVDAAGEHGDFEWEGRRARSGALRLAVSTTGLDLGSVVPWLLGARPDAKLAADVSGAIVLDSPSPGHGDLEVDLIARDFESAPDPVTRGPLVADRVALRGIAAISPSAVRLDGVQFSSDELALELDGTLERPLVETAHADLALAVRDVTVRDLRHLISWLPAVRRDEAERLLASIERGRLRLLRMAGSARLDLWQALLAGRTATVPENFVIDVQLDETTVLAGESDHIEDLSGRLWWSADRIEVRGARALLNGTPLPQLDLSVDGVSHLIAADDEARALRSGAEPLVGLQTLWRATHPESGSTGRLDVRLELDHLDHPMFFWPIRQADARLRSVEHGVSIALERGRWAGVPVRGSGTWLFEPEERVEAQFSAFAAPERPLPPTSDDAWATGRFEVGPIDAEGWRQRSATGAFSATGGRVALNDTRIELAPRGNARASGRLDLSETDRVPVAVEFAIEGGDLSQLGASVGLPRELATGTLDISGGLATTLRSDASLAEELTGKVAFEARDGTIRQAIPAVVAVALASAAVNPFASRDLARFDRFAAELEVDSGRLRTQSLTLDGPDVRAFASGGIDLDGEPYPMDVEVVLYLFRPVDFVLEKIPLINVLLLGPNDNLIAAHFNLKGPWSDPSATVVPHKSLTTGPGTMVFETMPALVLRGLRAIGSLVTGEGSGPAEAADPPAAPAES